jgi:hypothetical protein
MLGRIPSVPQYALMEWCSVKAQGQFYLNLYLYQFSIIPALQKPEIELREFLRLIILNTCVWNKICINGVINVHTMSGGSLVTTAWRVLRLWMVGRPRRRWEDNIKMDLREIGIDGVNWIQVAQDRVQWRAFMNMIMNVRVP